MVSARIKEGPRFKNQSNDDQDDIIIHNHIIPKPIELARLKGSTASPNLCKEKHTLN